MTQNSNSGLLVTIIGCGLCIMALGCADDGMVDVAGKVSMDGAAVAQGTISFLPTDNRGATAEAVIKDGSYSVTMPRGQKKVAIHGFKKVGERFPWGKDNPSADVLKEIVPSEFNEGSTLTLNANADDSDADFELTSPQ
jgi:hypothetical protein